MKANATLVKRRKAKTACAKGKSASTTLVFFKAKFQYGFGKAIKGECVYSELRGSTHMRYPLFRKIPLTLDHTRIQCFASRAKFQHKVIITHVTAISSIEVSSLVTPPQLRLFLNAYVFSKPDLFPKVPLET